MQDEPTRPKPGSLTRDKPHLSRPTTAGLGVSVSAINCTSGMPDMVSSYVCDSLAPNTRRAYLSDLAEFERWGGAIPASPEAIAAYLATRADALAVATLVRHVAAISKVHEARGLPNPTRNELVKATMRGRLVPHNRPIGIWASRFCTSPVSLFQLTWWAGLGKTLQSSRPAQIRT